MRARPEPLPAGLLGYHRAGAIRLHVRDLGRLAVETGVGERRTEEGLAAAGHPDAGPGRLEAAPIVAVAVCLSDGHGVRSTVGDIRNGESPGAREKTRVVAGLGELGPVPAPRRVEVG